MSEGRGRVQSLSRRGGRRRGARLLFCIIEAGGPPFGCRLWSLQVRRSGYIGGGCHFRWVGVFMSLDQQDLNITWRITCRGRCTSMIPHTATIRCFDSKAIPEKHALHPFDYNASHSPWATPGITLILSMPCHAFLCLPMPSISFSPTPEICTLQFFENTRGMGQELSCQPPHETKWSRFSFWADVGNIRLPRPPLSRAVALNLWAFAPSNYLAT